MSYSPTEPIFNCGHIRYQAYAIAVNGSHIFSCRIEIKPGDHVL